MFDLAEALYFLIPTAALLFFLTSLIGYIYLKHKNRSAPGTYSISQLRAWRICLIVSAVIVAALAVVVIAFFILLTISVAYM